MKIKEVIEKINGFSLVLNNEDKTYRFSATREYASCLNEDYIYLPLIENREENLFEELKAHLSNARCKGFFIDKKILDEPENQNSYHKLMKEFSSKIEVIVLVRNVFNSALKICEENVDRYMPQIVSISGSEEKSVLVNMVSYMLSQKGATLASVLSGGPWQKLFEPLLLIDENTKYCVIDIDSRKTNVSQNAGKILKNNTVLFSKTSVNYSNLYKGAQNYLFEITSILDYPENVKKVFTYEENDLVNTYIGQCENLEFIYESQIKSGILNKKFSKTKMLNIKYRDLELETGNFSYFIPRCAVMSAMCAKYLGADDKTVKKCFKHFKDISGTLIENRLENNNYSVLSTLEHTHFSTVNAIKTFCKKYKDYKKILVLSRIIGLGEYDRELHNDIIRQAAGEKFDTIVLIDMSDWGAYYRTLDKFAHIRKFSSKNNKLDERELMDIGLFLKGKTDSNTALLVCTSPSLNLEFLF